MAHYPDNWKHYCSYVPVCGASAFGFTGTTGDVNRFGARYRAAKSFRRIELEGYSAPTERGYSALCRVFFVWSALESLLRITGQPQNLAGPLLEKHGAYDVRARLRALDSDDRVYNFIYERVNGTHQRELEAYRNDDLCNFAYLASAIRHMFAHGYLTPNVDSVDSEVCVQICDELSDFVLEGMNREFAIGWPNS